MRAAAKRRSQAELGAAWGRDAKFTERSRGASQRSAARSAVGKQEGYTHGGRKGFWATGDRKQTAHLAIGISVDRFWRHAIGRIALQGEWRSATVVEGQQRGSVKSMKLHI